MSSQQQKRPLGVTASAVAAILGSGGSILLAGFMILSAVSARNQLLPTSQGVRPGPPMSAMAIAVTMVLMALVYLAFGAWGITSAVGLFRLRNWARQSFVVFGAIQTFFSLSATLGLFIGIFAVPQLASGNEGARRIITGIFVVFMVLALLSAGLGIAWAIYFTRPSTKAHFGAIAVEPSDTGVPFSIKVISWLMVGTGAIFPLMFFSSFPLMVAGFPIRGSTPRTLLILLYTAVCLGAGIGMLNKSSLAHTLAMSYFGFGALSALLQMLPGGMSRTRSVMEQLQGGPTQFSGMTEPFLWMGAIFGVIMTGGILWFLVTRRPVFVKAQ